MPESTVRLIADSDHLRGVQDRTSCLDILRLQLLNALTAALASPARLSIHRGEGFPVGGRLGRWGYRCLRF